jgi:hypothetical protein
MATEMLLDESRAALAAATIVGPFVYLPHELPPDVNRQVEQILVALRGTKNPRERAFIFPGDPAPFVQQALALNAVPQKNPLNFFWTSQSLLERMLANDPFTGATRLLEPTAGDGVIATGLRNRYPDALLDCGELDLFRRAVLEQQGFQVVCQNILDFFPRPDERYDAFSGCRCSGTSGLIA